MMETKTVMRFLLVLVVMLGNWSLGYWLGSRQPTPDAHPKLTDHCAVVSAALEMDAYDLLGGDPARRLAAAARFGAAIVYHSEPEILLCSKTPPDLTMRDRCWVTRDFDCLARLARAASLATR